MSAPESDTGPVTQTQGQFRIAGVVEDADKGTTDILLYDMDESEPLWLDGSTLARDVILETWPGNVLDARLVREPGTKQYKVDQLTVNERTTLSMTRVREERLPDTISALAEELGNSQKSTDLFRDGDGNPLYEVQLFHPPKGKSAEELFQDMTHAKFSFENWFQKDLTNFDQPAYHLAALWPQTEYLVFFCVPETTDPGVIRKIRDDINEYPFPE